MATRFTPTTWKCTCWPCMTTAVTLQHPPGCRLKRMQFYLHSEINHVAMCNKHLNGDLSCRVLYSTVAGKLVGCADVSFIFFPVVVDTHTWDYIPHLRVLRPKNLLLEKIKNQCLSGKPRMATPLSHATRARDDTTPCGGRHVQRHPPLKGVNLCLILIKPIYRGIFSHILVHKPQEPNL